MRAWNMNTYMYAPKDDTKHRANWRELYTVEEVEELQSLVAAAKENDIEFYYALSPGLDMMYSSTKEVAILKRKLEQVGRQDEAAAILLHFDSFATNDSNEFNHRQPTSLMTTEIRLTPFPLCHRLCRLG